MLLHALYVALWVSQPAPADLVIDNARIWSDGQVGFASSAAVRDGRFVAVGSLDRSLVGPRTQRLDAGARVVIPGLIDSHIHMLGGGQQLQKLWLRQVADRREFAQHVARWAAALPPGGWVLGGRWSTESWAAPHQPVKEWVDGVSGDHPLYLTRMDGHSVLVNSVALHLAGITADGPPDPPGGVIDRDPATGEPTGILRDAAMSLVGRLIPPAKIDEKVQALRRAIDEALAHGLTAVADIPDIDDLAAYERLASSDVGMRLFLYFTADDWAEAARRVRAFQGKPGRVEARGLKIYLDGSLGSRTACMAEPYLGNPPGKPQWRGLLRAGIEDGGLERNLMAAREAGLQPIAHAIGDQANHIYLDALQATFPDPGAARCRAEHVQHVLPEDLARYGNLGVIASMQPYHKADDGRYAEAYIGSARCASSYAYKTLLDTGAVLVFGSDWPVVSLNPFPGIETAVTGRTLDGRTWQTRQDITVTEALRCYTSRGAYAAFAEDDLGRIAPGYRADFVILDRSPFDPDVDWSAIRPVAVYVDGEIAKGGD